MFRPYRQPICPPIEQVASPKSSEQDRAARKSGRTFLDPHILGLWDVPHAAEWNDAELRQDYGNAPR